MTTPLASRLLSWYARHARQLPWRDHPDPYAVWVSEIMLQQTRVETVIPYFERWMERFPNVEALAQADQQAVLNAWEGLGYYSRARNLHKAAQILIQDHQGRLPQEPAELQALPGIGRYTAGAIASLAFGKDEAALDGNIRRVLARVSNLEIPARSPEGERQLWALAEAHLPAGRAGDYNQALMDLGAMVCMPRSPICSSCPLNSFCAAYAAGVQEQRPVRQPSRKTPHYTVTAAVMRENGRVLIARRPQDGLLGGMWEFPGGKCQADEALPACLQREIQEEMAAVIQVGQQIGSYQHAFTHFRITLHAFECRLEKGSTPLPQEHSDIRWVNPSELRGYPMGKIDRLIADQLASQNAGEQ